MTKEFLSRKGIDFSELNVLESLAALRQLILEFRRIVPVVLVGEEPISGYNLPRLRRALGLAEA